MKHRIKNIFTLMFVLIIVACSKKDNNDDLVIKLNPNKATPVKLEEWFESIEIVKLETSSQSLISNCNKIIEYEGRYYIFDSTQRVVIVFNKLGKFIFSSNDFKGKGPGEYAGLVDFNLNLFNKEIEILDAMDTKIMTYSLDGSYKRTIQLAPEVLPLYCYYPVTKDIYAFYTKKSQQRDESLIFYSLSSGKIVNKTGKLPNYVNYFPTTMTVPHGNRI
ncbi:MAG: 6-bladed beta-propeller [Prolixibacteraceae bacterium]|nr:6-bladed beta-propeller [Prolixibacteraceae bacterium]MBN2650259.1 6-bladed beta-propeller [Prolixibacteraceae bacterium]